MNHGRPLKSRSKAGLTSRRAGPFPASTPFIIVSPILGTSARTQLGRSNY
jgi:hypothetical protein